MKQNIIDIKEFQVSGIMTRTTNQNEMNSDTAKISTLWQKLEVDHIVNKIENQEDAQHLYGVYSNYSDEDRGEYDLHIGRKTDFTSSIKQPDEINSLKVQTGKYLCFTGEGQMPQIVMEIWEEIWGYFNSKSEFKRAFTTDYEKYDSEQESYIEIYISIK